MFRGDGGTEALLQMLFFNVQIEQLLVCKAWENIHSGNCLGNALPHPDCPEYADGTQLYLLLSGQLDPALDNSDMVLQAMAV